MKILGLEITRAGKNPENQTKADDQQLIKRGYQLFKEFMDAYTPEWERINKNERLYRAEGWTDIPTKDSKEPRPTTPVLFSTVENITSDLMDRVPESVIAPESPEDTSVAAVVEALIRQNHDAANYPQEYLKTVLDLCVAGYGVQEIGYDPDANRGFGGAFIRNVDVHSIMFDPQTADIQDGRAVFKFDTRTIEWLDGMYPELAGKFAPDEYSNNAVNDGDAMTKEKLKSVMVIEMWWKERVAEAEPGQPKWRVHMAKMANRILVEDSRKMKPEGYFAHGLYPFVVKAMLQRKGSPLGLGICDLFGGQQLYADKLDQIVMKNALMASHNKLLVTEASGFDLEDLTDWAKDVHRGESLNGVTWFTTPALPAYIVSIASEIRNGIKEECGANDFSRGNVASGVTAASAIAALQEMSNKRSRKISRLLHEMFREAVRMEIEVEREFSFLPRKVRVTVDGEQKLATFESSMMERAEGDMVMPIEFYVSIKVQSETLYSKQAQNDFILQCVQMGVIQPQDALELMQFEGKESVLGKARSTQDEQEVAEEDAAVEQQMQQEQIANEIQQLPQPDEIA